MDVGHELIRQQLFFRQELRERVYWFIKLRWAAAAAGIAGVAAAYFLDLKIPFGLTLAVVLFVPLYNCLFLLIGRRLAPSQEEVVAPFVVFAHVQISFDLFALFLLILFTGGLASPLLSFVIFHVILAGILLSPLSCFIYALVTQISLGLLILVQLSDFVPVWVVHPSNLWFSPRQDLIRTLVFYFTFAAGVLIAAYLVTSIKVTLRFKGRELLRVSKALDLSNTKLTSIYEMIKEAGAHDQLQALMDSATRNAARIMGVKASSIKVYDPEADCLRFASTCGLSEDYLAKDCVSVSASAINRQIIEGRLYSIGSIDESSYFQYPEDIRKEGIASMLCLPIKVENKLLGVFCVYSPEPHYFDEAGAGFFTLITELTAMAMERVKRDTARTWFMNKAAHQLRSPLGAVQSMLHLITGGFLGPVGDKVKETVARSRKRLSLLQEVINDLLKLATETEVGAKLPFTPIDLADALKAFEPVYKTQASAKEVAIEFETQDGLPPVWGLDRMIDELMTNLISNAIKYTPAGGRVWVRLRAQLPRNVVFEVQDTGIGIPESARSRLFSEFFRAENAKAMVEEGTGLGLVIVKEIVDRLRGKIAIESQVGQGTRVTCQLPVQSR
ncbi:MAG: GAF domain-containing sensor histidine kinase [Thermodesulfobacteriota bacterium]